MENTKKVNGATWKWVPIATGIGLATGVIVGLLYAPKEGKETRKYLREKARRFGSAFSFRRNGKHEPAARVAEYAEK